MSVGPAFRAAYRTYVSRPADVLPLYVAGLSVPVVARVIPILGAVVAYVSIAGTGRLDRLEAVLEDAAPIHVDDPNAVVGIDAEALEPALEEVVTPTLVAILAVSAVVALLVVLVVAAAVSAGQLHAVFAAIQGRPGTDAAVEGAFQHTRTFVGLYLAELLVYVAVFLAVGVAVWASSLLGAAVAVLVAALSMLAFVPVFAFVRLTFAFAVSAAVVEGVGTTGALAAAHRHVRARPWESVGYGLLAIVVLLVGGFVASVVGGVGAATVGSLLSMLVLLPLLDATKTALYADARGETLSIPPIPDESSVSRARSGLAEGWRELASFTRSNLALLALSTAVLAVGVLVGLRVGATIDHIFVASIERRLEQAGVVGSGLEYAANNWSVGAAQAFAGLALGVPTLVSLLVNGANVGVLYQLEADPETLLLFVVPHGVVEIPALLISGALGLHLGRVGLHYLTVDADRTRLATELQRAYRVVVGLAILFVVAAIVEAFVSPFYWRLLGL